MKMTAIIIAAGMGSRISPYTDNNSKTLFKVNGIPLLKYHIENLKTAGFTKIVITTFWQKEKIIETIGNIEGVYFYKEETLLETGTAVSNVMKEYHINRTVIIYGDTWYHPKIYSELIDLYKQKRNFVFVQDITTISDENKDKLSGLILYKKSNSLVVEISENGEFSHIANNCLVGKNTGILVLSKVTVGDYIKRPMDLMKDYLPILVKHLPQPNQLYAYDNRLASIAGFPYWHDIGTLERYIEISWYFYFYKSQIGSWLLNNHKNLIIEFTKKILSAKRIFICGNGGSLSTAQHLALDWSKVGKKETIALDSPAAMSAYGNDEGYDNVFLSQLKRYKISKNDVIVLISGSGNSPNIVKIIENYVKKDVLLGMSGITGKLIDSVDLTLPVPSDNIRVIEDAHLSYGHAITEIMDGLN